uniref:ABC transporter domain-containing protein n=1 Tax=Syphacia muris TaxID=451379 RepID=A0A0N5AB26_9BILA
MTIVVILYATPSFGAVVPFLAIVYYTILDLDTVDCRLPGALISAVAYYVYGLFTAFVPVIVTPPVLFVFIGISTAYYFLMRFYVSTSRQLKRLESTSRSPIYSHFQESIQGATCIRAYKKVNHFIKESQEKVDSNLAIYYPSIVANRWLAVRLELIGNLIVAFSALFAVFYRDSRGVTAGLAGLSVSYALNITQTLNWAVRITSELETNIVAVERLKEYTESLTEGSKNQLHQRKPNNDWPSKGEIVIKNLYLRYRQNLDYVLKGISVLIQPNEKIGVVGRTGAGKSSLMIALFRIVEADSGSIEIDGEDLAKLPLEYLRSKLTIVPQDPVLFSGTLRMNLDPFEASSDAQIWEALKMAHLEPFIASLPDRLDHSITEGGENLSVGQRQLICLARALLRKTKILILDEAAASVDMETDALIQKTIREQFSDCTVLTIAHRLQTVIELDRVIVMDNGTIKEFDAPKKLLSNKSSLFYSMAKDAGIAD